jgi:hypothetical protein
VNINRIFHALEKVEIDDGRQYVSAWKAEKHDQKAYFDHLETQD